MKKGWLVLLFLLIPATCFGKITGPKFDGYGGYTGVEDNKTVISNYENYRISSENTWTTPEGLEITFYYEHYSQREHKSTKLDFYLPNSHFDGAKYVLTIKGLDGVKRKEIKKRLGYQIGEQRGGFNLTDRYSNFSGFNRAVSINSPKEEAYLRISAYRFYYRDMRKMRRLMGADTPVSFFVIYNDVHKPQLEIKIPQEVVAEMVQARNYDFDKTNKKKLREIEDMKYEKWREERLQEEEKWQAEGNEALRVMNDSSTVFTPAVRGEEEIMKFGKHDYKYIGTVSNPKDNQEWGVYAPISKKRKREIAINVISRKEEDSKKRIIYGTASFAKKKTRMRLKSYRGETDYVIIEENTVLSYIRDNFVK